MRRAWPPRMAKSTSCGWQPGNARLLMNRTVAGSASAPPGPRVDATQPPGLGGPVPVTGPGDRSRFYDQVIESCLLGCGQ